MLLAGCGSDTFRSVNAPVPPPPPGVQIAGQGLRGPLETYLVITDFAANRCPYTEAQIHQVGVDLNAFIVRNSTGAATVDFHVLRVTLPQSTYTVTRVQDPDGSSHFNPDAALEYDSKAVVPTAQQVNQRRFVIYFTPPEPAIYSGYAGGYAWISASEEFPFNLPVPHEFGHLLSLPHVNPGVMSGVDAAAQKDWSGFYAPQLRDRLGWL